MKARILPKKRTKHTKDTILSVLRWFLEDPECVSFVFWKNQRSHNLLSRFTDLYNKEKRVKVSSTKSVQTFLFEIQKMPGNLFLNIKQRLGQGHLHFASNLRRI